jgi:hypothetical protein
VNGARIRTTSQQAVTRENIDVVATTSSKLRASRQPSKSADFSRERPDWRDYMYDPNVDRTTHHDINVRVDDPKSRSSSEKDEAYRQ